MAKTKKSTDENDSPDITGACSDTGEQTTDDVSGEKDKLISKLTEEKDSLIALVQRIQADFDNYRKRNNSIRDDAYNEGIADAILKFLPIADSLDMALEAEKSGNSFEKLYEGLVIISKQIKDILKDMNIREIDAQKGVHFDPRFHEAIAGIETDDGEPGTIVDQFRKGYTFKEKIIRHSMVRVIK